MIRFLHTHYCIFCKNDEQIELVSIVPQLRIAIYSRFCRYYDEKRVPRARIPNSQVKPSLPFNFSNIVGKPYRITWRVSSHGWGIPKIRGLV
jgi:hypothetical protein